MSSKKKMVRITSQTHFSSQTITPFGAVKFDERGVSEPIPFEAAEYLLQFPNYSEYEEAEAAVSTEPDAEKQAQEGVAEEWNESVAEKKPHGETVEKEEVPEKKSTSAANSKRGRKPKNESGKS